MLVPEPLLSCAIMTSRVRFLGFGAALPVLSLGSALVLAAALGAVALPACSSTSATDGGTTDGGTLPVSDAETVNDTGTSPVPDATPDLQMRPEISYSGFDGTRTFTVPFAVYGSGADLKITASDPTAVDIKPATLANPQGDDGKYVLLTMKKAGNFTISAETGGRKVSSQLVVAAYPTARFAAGDARYKTGFAPKSEPACTQCHGGATGIDHSPASLASVPDEEVAVIISTGILNGQPIVIPGAVKHQWTTTPTEMDGLVTFLRALPPKGFK